MLLLVSYFAQAQTNYSYSYIEPCSGKQKTIVIPYGQNNVTVNYYGNVSSFNANDFNSGVFSTWMSNIAQINSGQPCGEITTVLTNNVNMVITQNVISTVMNVTSIAAMTQSMSNLSSNLGNTVSNSENGGSSPGGKKNNKNNVNSSQNNSGSSSGNTPGSGNTVSSNQNQGQGSQVNTNTTNGTQGSSANTSTNGNSGATNTNGSTSGQSGTNGSSTSSGQTAGGSTGGSTTGQPTGGQVNSGTNNQGNGTSNTNGGSSTTSAGNTPTSGNGQSSTTTGGNTTNPGGEGGSTNNSTNGNSSTSQSTVGNTSTSGNTNSTGNGNTNNGNSGSSTGNPGTGNNTTTPPNNQDNTSTAKSSGSGNTANSIANAEEGGSGNSGGKGGKSSTKTGQMIAVGDIVAIGSAEDPGSENQYRFTASLTRANTNNTRVFGVLGNYTTGTNNTNITAYMALMIPQSQLTIIGANSSMMNFEKDFFNTTTTMVSKRFKGNWKKLTIMGGLNFTAGNFGETRFTNLSSIGGGFYSFNVSKKLSGSILCLAVYSPFTQFYDGQWWESSTLLVPFSSWDYAITKTFKLNISLSGVYEVNKNVLNYQVLTGGKILF